MNRRFDQIVVTVTIHDEYNLIETSTHSKTMRMLFGVTALLYFISISTNQPFQIHAKRNINVRLAFSSLFLIITHSYHASSDQTAATADPTIFPTDVCEFHIPIIRPRLHKKYIIALNL